MSSKVDDRSAGKLNRRTLLRCAAWGGAGVVWALKGGVPRSFSLIDPVAAAEARSLAFVQISDSHIGFNKDANPDPNATLGAAIEKVRALPTRGGLYMLHTAMCRTCRSPRSSIRSANHRRRRPRRSLCARRARRARRQWQRILRALQRRSNSKWYSFDALGAHFIALTNVLDLRAGGLGRLGEERIDWLEKDLRGGSASTPLIVFTHMPLWDLYPEWGWGTDDSARALTFVKRFGSVTVLNGHVHQVLQEGRGASDFHTAMWTAFPAAGSGNRAMAGSDESARRRYARCSACAGSPRREAAARLQLSIGRSREAAHETEAKHRLSPTVIGALVTFSVAADPAATPKSADNAHADEIVIDNFMFGPSTLTVCRNGRDVAQRGR